MSLESFDAFENGIERYHIRLECTNEKYQNYIHTPRNFINLIVT